MVEIVGFLRACQIVSEYRKRDLMAQKSFLELLIQSYSMMFELYNKLLSESLPKRKVKLQAFKYCFSSAAISLFS